jgi:hypothetical protein
MDNKDKVVELFDLRRIIKPTKKSYPEERRHKA